MYKGHNFDLYVATDKWNNEEGIPLRRILPISENKLAAVNRPKLSSVSDTPNVNNDTNDYVTQPHLLIYNQEGTHIASFSTKTIVNCILIWKDYIICGK